ncbi:TatD family hydrolase [Fusobacterium sp. PH5-44]|uniref:TatD family hydrolase n=1 Tax=unclassified Fusobacterium TaxID=2648384 RepID=UPI003D244A46
MKLLTDSHAHLDSDAFDDDRDQVIKRISENMDFVVNIGYDIKSSLKSIEYAKEYEFIYAVIGVHPIDIAEYNDKIEKRLLELGKEKKVLAIGEIGLDYHWMTTPKEVQMDAFRRQMEIARMLNKPVVIHTRDAMEDTINILEEFSDITGIIHCYPGSVEIAERMKKNYYFGIGGVLTFKNSKKLVEVVREIEIERLVIETDCPYMTPVPYRGKRNEPIYTEFVAKKIAEIKNISYEEVLAITNKNAREVYKM